LSALSTNHEVRAVTIQHEAVAESATSDVPSIATCPLALAISVIGGKWKMLVLRALFAGGAQRYNELLRGVDSISAKELTRNLRELEAAGLVCRTRRAAQLRDMEAYTLTDLGASIRPAFVSLGEFGKALERTRGAGRRQ
jgi:DNA-binding HxlR family transcriptional regulator